MENTSNYDEYNEGNYEETESYEEGYEEGYEEEYEEGYEYNEVTPYDYDANDYNPNIIAWGVAIYRYEAQSENELTFNEGDWIGILEELPDGWSKGDYYGIEGLFPTSYVQKMEQTNEDTTTPQPTEEDEEAIKKKRERRDKLKAQMKEFKEELVSENKQRKQLEKELKELNEKKLKLQKEVKLSKASLPDNNSILYDLLKLTYTIDVHTDAVVDLEKPTKDSVEALNQFNTEFSKESKGNPSLGAFQSKIGPKLTSFSNQLQRSLELLVECQTLGMDFNNALEKLAKVLGNTN